MDREYPFIFGLQLTFRLSSGSEVDSGARYTINISKNFEKLSLGRERAK